MVLKDDIKNIFFCLMVFACLAFAMPSSSLAGQKGSFLENVKEAGKDARQDFKKAGEEIKEAGKDAAQKLGETKNEITKDLKKKVKKTDKDAEKGFKKTLGRFSEKISETWEDFLEFIGWD